MPSWAIINPQNSTRFVATAITTAGEAAMNDAVSAVIARPPHIHPYTDRRNVVIRSSTGRDALKGVSGVISNGAMSDSLDVRASQRYPLILQRRPDPASGATGGATLDALNRTVGRVTLGRLVA